MANRNRNRRRRPGAGGRKGRPKQRRAKLPKSFLEEVTPKQARRESRAASKLQFGDTRRQLKGEKRASRKREKEIADWFEHGYQPAVQKAQSSTAGAYKTALENLAKQTEASSGQESADREALAKTEAADQATRGAHADTSGSKLSGAAAASRRNLADTFSALTGYQGAVQGGYLADKGRIGEGEKIRQLSGEAARGRSINADLRELAKSKGAFKTDYLRQARDAERQYNLERMAFEKPSASQKSQLKLARRYGKNKKREQQRSVANQLTVTQAQARAERADDRRSRGYAKKYGGPSKKGGGGSQADLKRANAYLKSAEPPSWVAKNKSKSVAYLINRGVDPKIAKRAVNRYARKAGGGGGDSPMTFR